MCQVTTATAWIGVTEVDKEVDEVLTRAKAGVFCLHASAVRVDDHRVIAFVGESGRGKSTLALLVHSVTGGAWSRVADDVLPAWVAGDSVLVDPTFRQPKLPPEDRYRHVGVVPLGLAAVFHLEASGAPDEVATTVVRPFEALAIIAGNTMGARLFHRELLDDHLGFCRDVAERLPVSRLAYPRRFSITAEVVRRIAANLSITSPLPDATRED